MSENSQILMTTKTGKAKNDSLENNKTYGQARTVAYGRFFNGRVFSDVTS